METPASRFDYRTFLVKAFLFVGLIVLWNWVARTQSPPALSAVMIVAGIVVIYPVVWVFRIFLDRNPTVEHARFVTACIHYTLMLLLGLAIVEAVQTAVSWKGFDIPFPDRVAYGLVLLTGGLLAMTVLNLALRGAGAPFALALSKRLASDWLYAWTRNPMLLAVISFLVALGLLLRSALFLVWVLFLVTPAWIYFVRHYEERELEIRFGEPYRSYKKETSFLFPRRPAHTTE